MKVWMSALLTFAFVACEPKPSPEEIQVQEKAAEEAARATPKPSPKPGDWMLKNYKNPLDGKKPGAR